MTFQRKTNITIERIGGFESVLTSPDPLGVEVQAGRVIMSDRSIQFLSFNLLARLQDDATELTHLANLAALRDYIRTRLENEVLPL